MRLTPPAPPHSADGRTMVFLGPSLAPREAAALLPDAQFRPPVRMGDLYALLTAPVETVLLIDGVFHGVTPVWQREILALLASGKRVIGAASMGALRALELEPYGMIGVGQVFEWYRDGIIEGDDEVALLHADHELDYRPLTMPLVDIRHILNLAAKGGVLTPGEAATLANRLKSLGHAQRTERALLEAAAEIGADARALRPRLGAGRASLKADDARQALRLVAGPAALATMARGTRSWDLPVLRAGREHALLRAGHAPDGRSMRVIDALEASIADQPATARRLREASRRWFLVDWAKATGHGPGAPACSALAERWLASHATALELTPDAWLAASGLSRDDLPEHLRGHTVEAWLGDRTAQSLRFDPAPPTCPLIPLAIADWARRNGVVPPTHVPNDPQAIAAWIVQSGPAHFGVSDWDADVAVARTQQIEGGLADLLMRDAQPTPPTPSFARADAGAT